MPETHAQIARRMTITMPDGAFAYAARDAVIHANFLTLERMFPGMKFATRKTAPDEWELVGTCEDGSVVIWAVGG